MPASPTPLGRFDAEENLGHRKVRFVWFVFSVSVLGRGVFVYTQQARGTEPTGDSRQGSTLTTTTPHHHPSLGILGGTLP